MWKLLRGIFVKIFGVDKLPQTIGHNTCAGDCFCVVANEWNDNHYRTDWW